MKEDYQDIMQDWDYGATPDIVKIVWMDAHTCLGTQSYKEIRENKLAQAMTIGYLMDEKEEHIAICSFLFPDQSKDLLEPDNLTAFRDVHIIPKSQIKTILVLKTDWEASKSYKRIYVKEEINKKDEN